MTQEEITTIVEQVLQALLTNGKTIAQLTAVQNVSDSDCFEISGGKKVSFQTLAGLLINQISNIENFNVVDYDGRDEVVTFSYAKSTGVITIKQSGRTEKTVTIPAATTTRPGLMSTTDKTNLTSAVNKILSSFSKSSTASNVKVTATFADESTLDFTLSAASTTSAGLMSAADKSNLNTAKNTATNLNNKLGAANGIATLDSNGKLNSEQLPTNVVTDMDALAKADKDDSERLKASQAPRNILYNVVNNADLNGLVRGDIYFQEGHLFEFEYINNHGSRISVDLGVPEKDIIYSHRSTGLLYKWDSTNGVFLPLAPQVMKSMGTTLDNVGNSGMTQFMYEPNIGDIYFAPASGTIVYKQSDNNTITIGAPSKLLIYCNAQTNRLYRWSGTAMVEVGNN